MSVFPHLRELRAERAGVLILFGGGDGGGIWIGPDGVHPIDPFGPAVVAALQAAAAVTSPRLGVKDAAVRKSAVATANQLVAPHIDAILKVIPAAAK